MNQVHAFPSHFSLLILPTYLTYFFQVVAFLQDFPAKSCTHFSFPPHVPHEIIRTQEVNSCEKKKSTILYHNAIWISTSKFQPYMPSDGIV
jgi:hypothetical protein